MVKLLFEVGWNQRSKARKPNQYAALACIIAKKYFVKKNKSASAIQNKLYIFDYYNKFQ